MNPLLRSFLWSMSFCWYAGCCVLSAQTVPSAYTRHEVSVGLGVNLRDEPDYPAPTLRPVAQGIARYTYNLSPNLGVEASYRYGGGPYYGASTDGGAETFLGGGVKGTVRRGRWELFGTLEPGIASFTNGLVGYTSNGGYHPYRYTHFALDVGMGVQRNLSRRTFVRMDAGTLLATEFEQILNPLYYNGYLVLYQQTTGRVANFFESSVSIGHRFGGLREEQPIDTASPRATVGMTFPLFARGNLLDKQIRFDRGLGVWASLPVSRHVDVDGAGFTFPRFDRTGDFQDGGKPAMATLGVKTGIRRDHLGLFAKARAGAIRFSNAYDGATFATNDEYINSLGHRVYQPVVDVGGVVEAYPVKHMVLRTEMGPAIVVYRPATLTISGTTYAVDANHTTGLLLTFGVGYRF